MFYFPLSGTAFLTLLFLCSLFTPCYTSVRNVTIDDQWGDEETGLQVMYQPANMWEQGANCTTCLLAPDDSMAYGNTWHDGTWLGQAPNMFSFTLLFNSEYF